MRMNVAALCYLQVISRHTAIEVGDLHLGTVGHRLADSSDVEGSCGGGTVLLDAGGVGSVVTTLASVASRSRAGAATSTTEGTTTGSTVGLLGLDDVIQGHIECGSHCGCVWVGFDHCIEEEFGVATTMLV